MIFDENLVKLLVEKSQTRAHALGRLMLHPTTSFYVAEQALISLGLQGVAFAARVETAMPWARSQTLRLGDNILGSGGRWEQDIMWSVIQGRDQAM